MRSIILEKQLKIYSDNFNKYRDSPKGVFWNNSETQNLRFERLLKNFNLEKKISIHDVGCGVADLHNYLIKKNIKHDYVGTEIVQDMIDVAKKKFPKIKIYNRDILKDKLIQKCDIFFISGTFNLSSKTSVNKWEKFVLSMINRMFELSNHGIAFNFLTSYKTFSDQQLAYFNPEELFGFCMKNLSRFVILDHAYPLYEATITVFHEEYFKTKYKDKVFQKYFKK